MSETLDILWIVIAAALVMFMQGGFTLLESGLVRAKNSINVAIKNLVDFCLSATLYWIFGFAIMFGGSVNGWFGSTGFFFGQRATPFLMAFFLFQLVFAGTATTIVSGAVAERMRFSGYIIVSIVTTTLVYPVVGHWVWGGLAEGAKTGWLASRGFVDFAGSTVVHSVGGWIALAAILILGARKGRFGKDGQAILGHNLPQAALGALVLWFGWFGFNGGSTLAVNGTVPFIIVNTIISGAFGGLAALAIRWTLTGIPDADSIIQGTLAGLVSITASANIVSVGSAAIIGLVGGSVAIGLILTLERFEIDDAVSAFPVHVGGGVWGTLAVALFAGPQTLQAMEISRFGLLGIQLTGIIATFLWAFGLSYLLFWTLNTMFPLRVTEEEEDIGLNVAEHGAKTVLFTMLDEMEAQRLQGDLSMRVTVEPYTEIGAIAGQYNRVLDEIQHILGKAQSDNKQLQQSIMQLLTDVTQIADGNLTIEAEVSEDATGAIADSFNFMVEELREIILKVRSGSLHLSESLHEIQTTAEVITNGAQLQAQQIVDTTAAIDEMSVSIQQVSESAALSASVGEQSRANALRGSQAVRATMSGLNRIQDQVNKTSGHINNLGERTEQIVELLQRIQGISERTSILAINASIQAREAGSAGRGFAVVANEVQSLAERSSETATLVGMSVRAIQNEMSLLIDSISETRREVVHGGELAAKAGVELSHIETVSEQLANLIRSISLAAKQQARGSETIALAMSDISQVTQQTSIGTTQTTSSLQSLGVLAEDLQAAISRFKTEATGMTMVQLDSVPL